MLRKFFKIWLMLLQITVLCLIAAAGAFFWRLHKGPIEINNMIPFLVEMASTSDVSSRISIASAQLSWGSLSHPVEIVVTDFKSFNKNDQLVLSVPKLSTSFSIQALLRGRIAPRTLAIYEPYLHLYINKEGTIESKTEETDAADKQDKTALPIDTLVKQLQREDYLAEFSLIKARIKVTDVYNDAVWNMPKVNLTFMRRFRKNLLEGSLVLQTQGDRQLTLNLNGSWKKGKRLDLAVSVANLDLTKLSAAQKYPYLKNFTTPVDVTIETRLNATPLLKKNLAADWRNIIERINFEITGGEGIVHLPAPVIARYNLKNFQVRGSWYAAGNNFDLPFFELTLQNGAYAAGNMAVEGIGEALDTKNWGPVRATLNASAKNIPLDLLPDYWPASVGPDVHEWVKENLSAGMATDGTFALHFTGLAEEGGIDADKVEGSVNVTGARVTYMDDMPAVVNVAGNVHLTRDVITITLKQGNTDSITITDGTLKFIDLIQPLSSGVLNLNLTGSVRDILTVLDAPPLELTREMGLEPKNVTGTAAGNFQLAFPVGDAFESVDQLKIKASADVRNADVNDIVLGYGLQDAVLHMDLQDKDVSVTGTALFYSSSAKYTLLQSFDKTKEIQTDISLHIDLNDRARERLDFSLLKPAVVTGVMPTDLKLVNKNNGTGTVSITSNLTNTAINVREIGWKKPAKTAGKGIFRLQLHNGILTDIPLVELTDANKTFIQGKIAFGKTGDVSKVEFDRIDAQRTQAKLRISFLPNETVRADLSGAELDISNLLGGKSSFESSGKNKTAGKTKKTDRTMYINAAFDKLWLSKDGYSENNAFSAVYRHFGWEDMDLIGYVGDQRVPLRLSLSPMREENQYKLLMTSEDAGYTLKAMDYISTVKGGKLKLSGIYVPDIGSEGTVEISNFYLEEQQVFTRLLMLTSLTGIIDTLRGEGLYFSKADIPYKTDETSLTVSDAVIAGSSLGITLNGKYYRETGFLNLRGTLVPFYTLNSFLGKIPLIGRVFSGEKGGGLIAPTYTIRGKLPNPDISVNAFSALAPGAVRSLFGKIAQNDGDLSKEEEALPEQLEDAGGFIMQEEKNVQDVVPAVETELNDVLHRE